MQQNFYRSDIIMKDEEKREETLDGAVDAKNGKYPIHCLTIIGQIEGHYESNNRAKTTKYEHVIPRLIDVEENPDIKGLLIILNTVGGDVEAGLAISELIRGLTKPTASLVLGGGHSIGIPLAVSRNRSFIVPTATMTVHPVRHSGTVLGVERTMDYLWAIQDRITSFVCENSKISKERFTALMQKSGDLIMDLGTVLNGREAVKEGIVDQIGNLSDALKFLYGEIEKNSGIQKN